MEEVYTDRDTAIFQAQLKAYCLEETWVATGDEATFYEIMPFKEWRNGDKGDYIARFNRNGDEVMLGWPEDDADDMAQPPRCWPRR